MQNPGLKLTGTGQAATSLIREQPSFSIIWLYDSKDCRLSSLQRSSSFFARNARIDSSKSAERFPLSARTRLTRSMSAVKLTDWRCAIFFNCLSHTTSLKTNNARQLSEIVHIRSTPSLATVRLRYKCASLFLRVSRDMNRKPGVDIEVKTLDAIAECKG